MIAKINEPDFVAGIDEAQTTKLLSKFKKKFLCESNAIPSMDEIIGCVPRSVEKERHPPLRHQGIRSGGNLRVFENLAQTLVAVDAS